MPEEVIAVLGKGALVVWFLRIAGPLRAFWGSSEMLTEMRDCDACLGFWIYLVLTRRPMQALIYAFLFLLTRTGWNTLFRYLHVED